MKLECESCALIIEVCTERGGRGDRKTKVSGFRIHGKKATPGGDLLIELSTHAGLRR